MEYSMITKILRLSLFVAFGFIYKGEAAVLSCPSCMHVDISMEGVDQDLRNHMNYSYGRMYNPACQRGDVSENSRCSSSNGTTTKCQSIVIRLKAVKMRDQDPNAVIKALVINRTCTERPLGEPDKCVDMHDIELEVKTYLQSQYDHYRPDVESFTESGSICFAKGDAENLVTLGHGGPFQSSNSSNQSSPVTLPTGTAKRLFSGVNIYMVFAVTLLTLVIKA